MSSQIRHTHTHTQSSNIHPLAHILDTWALIFRSCAFFYSLSQPHYAAASFPSSGEWRGDQSMGGRSERTQSQAKVAAWISFSCICTETTAVTKTFSNMKNVQTSTSTFHKELVLLQWCTARRVKSSNLSKKHTKKFQIWKMYQTLTSTFHKELVLRQLCTNRRVKSSIIIASVW